MKILFSLLLFLTIFTCCNSGNEQIEIDIETIVGEWQEVCPEETIVEVICSSFIIDSDFRFLITGNHPVIAGEGTWSKSNNNTIIFDPEYDNDVQEILLTDWYSWEIVKVENNTIDLILGIHEEDSSFSNMPFSSAETTFIKQ